VRNCTRARPGSADATVCHAVHPTDDDRMQTLSFSRFCCVAVLMLWPAGTMLATAQDVYRQTVVVTAATTPLELADSARAVTVISRQEIAALPVSSVADVLRLVASVDVRARGVRGIQSDFAIRGAGFGQMLVLVDGVRLNDPQSGHHNGDVPVPLESVERIEVLHGPGSSFFGADAFGGTVNVITRGQAGQSRLMVTGGSFGTVGGQGAFAVRSNRIMQTVSGSFERSDGFTYDRDFNNLMVHGRTALGDRTGVTVSALRREFGANNFYGGNAPSREWTNQTLVAFDHRQKVTGRWSLAVDGSYRTHGDRFVFDQENPARSDNRHRTHAVVGRVAAMHESPRQVVSLGIEGGGDVIRSTNLGDHELSRVSGFAQWRSALGPRAHMSAAIRFDAYSTFGDAWSPSLEFSWWASHVIKLRASTGRAFRVPTFTERYYSDPANLARADVRPEHAWSGEGGADVALPGGVLVQGTLFRRADRDVIDWLRQTPIDRWQTYNIREVDTIGVETGVRRHFGNGAFLLADYTWLDLDAPDVTQLSKYAMDYAPHSLVAAGSVFLPWRVRVAPRIEYKRRTRSTGSEDYVLLDVRVGRRLSSLLDVYVDGTNLLDRSYSEVAGVPMPGVAMMVSLAIGR
jgi:outer membrane cobalamin receptor